MAQSSETKTRSAASEVLAQANVSILAGPSSVGGQMDKDREAKGTSAPVPRLSERYFRFKNRVEEEYGFSFGFDYNALFQAARNFSPTSRSAGSARGRDGCPTIYT